jgi:hypothetical protein
MTVEELIEELKKHPAEMPVWIAHSESDMPPRCGFGMGFKIVKHKGNNFNERIVLEPGYFYTRCCNECSNCTPKPNYR